MSNAKTYATNFISGKQKLTDGKTVSARICGYALSEPTQSATRTHRYGRFYLARLDHNGGANQSVLRIEPQAQKRVVVALQRALSGVLRDIRSLTGRKISPSGIIQSDIWMAGKTINSFSNKPIFHVGFILILSELYRLPRYAGSSM